MTKRGGLVTRKDVRSSNKSCDTMKPFMTTQIGHVTLMSGQLRSDE